MSSDLSWRAPLADWLPMHRAPFYLLPLPVKPGAELEAAMLKLLQRLFSGRGSVKAEGAEKFSVTVFNARLVINAADGELEIDNGRDDDDISDGIYVWGRLSEFCRKAEEYSPDEKYSAAFQSLVDMSQSLRIYLSETFERSIREGHAQVVGRWNSIGADYAPVYPDQWQYLRGGLRYSATDEYDGQPCAPVLQLGDTTIYHPMVRPLPVLPEARAELDCGDWLIDKMRRDEVATKDALRQQAKKRWGRSLGTRAWGRAWDRAQNLVQNKHFGRGAKSAKLKHHTPTE